MKQPFSATRAAALGYRRRGWSVVPIAPHEKRPLVPWTEFQHRLASPDEIEAWFARWPDANVGIVTGAISGLVVVDIDPGHGGEQSMQTLAMQAPAMQAPAMQAPAMQAPARQAPARQAPARQAPEGQKGALPPTVEVLTGGGGRHLYFRHPGIALANRTGLAPGIDIRADGGLVVAPPSIHPSGRPYRFAHGKSPDSQPLAALPDWLRSNIAAPGHGHPVGYWRGLVKSGVTEGARNNAIASLTGHLLWHGVDPQVATELLLCWNAVRASPPLPADELVRTVESVRRTHERDKKSEAERDRS